MKINQLLLLLTLSKIVFTSPLKIESLKTLLPSHPEIEYIKCHDAQPFEYMPFPISKFPEFQPHEGLFAESFILKIPQGQAGTTHGFIKVENTIIQDCMAPYWSLTTQLHKLQQIPFHNITHIPGKVAVITMLWDDNYFHWIANILSRLALLEMHNIEYDWLYVAYDKPFMKETLTLWGIDSAKIIQPFGSTKYIQADELIVPSHSGVRMPLPHQYVLNWIPLEQYCKLWNLDPQALSLSGNNCDINKDVLPNNIATEDYFLTRTPLCSAYFPPYIVDYLSSKFLSFIDNKSYGFSKKVFISRADSQFRKIINEDEIFKLFEQEGFTRYVLSSLSIPEQVDLFNNADIIVAAHGAGLINLMFCKPRTTVIEIFQARSDSCFYYLSQLCNLEYYCIQTMDFINLEAFRNNTAVPLFIIKECINTIILDK